MRILKTVELEKPERGFDRVHIVEVNFIKYIGWSKGKGAVTMGNAWYQTLRALEAMAPQ